MKQATCTSISLMKRQLSRQQQLQRSSATGSGPGNRGREGKEQQQHSAAESGIGLVWAGVQLAASRGCAASAKEC